MKVAAVDIRADALSLVVATVADSGAISLLGEFSIQVDTALERAPDGPLPEEAIASRLKALASCHSILVGFGEIGRIRVLADNHLQGASNLPILGDLVRKAFGTPLEVVPPDEEAAYSFLGSWDVGGPLADGLSVVVSPGMEATALVVGQQCQVLHVEHLTAGLAPLARTFLDDNEPGAGSIAICEHLERTLDLGRVREVLAGRPFNVVGCGPLPGSIGALALEADGPQRDLVHGLALSLDDLSRILERLVGTPPESDGDPSGSDALLSGLALSTILLEKLGAQEMVVSANGVGHGMLREICGLDRPIV